MSIHYENLIYMCYIDKIGLLFTKYFLGVEIIKIHSYQLCPKTQFGSVRFTFVFHFGISIIYRMNDCPIDLQSLQSFSIIKKSVYITIGC